jgi:hypothetical protein
MRPSAKIIPLGLVGLVVLGIIGFVLYILLTSWFSDPPFGLGHAPPQPIAFPHTVHAGPPEAGGAGIQCEFCHRNVTKGAAATVPASETCMFCHSQIQEGNLVGTTAVNLAEIQQLVNSFQENQPIDWERVHRLPDHVRFIHEAHIRFLTQADPQSVTFPLGDRQPRQLPLPVEESCAVCHGNVAGMVEVQPAAGFAIQNMGTCVDCHQVVNAATDCTICHK